MRRRTVSAVGAVFAAVVMCTGSASAILAGPASVSAGSTPAPVPGPPSGLPAAGTGRIAGQVRLAGENGLGPAAGSVCVAARLVSPAAGSAVAAAVAPGEVGTSQAQTVEVRGTSGDFLLAGLTPGSWVVGFKHCGRPFSFRAASYDAGKPVEVRAGLSSYIGSAALRREVKVTGTGFTALQAIAAEGSPVRALSRSSLTASGYISGKVTSKAGAELKGICVEAFEYSSGTPGGKAVTRADGSYKMRVAPGTWAVGFGPGCGNDGNWLDAFYGGAFSPPGNPVKVVAGRDHRGVDAALALGGEISGVIKSSLGKVLHNGLAEASMNIGNSFYIWGDFTQSGKYVLHSMPAGRWKIMFEATGNWVAQWYDHKASLAAANVLSVTTGTVFKGIDGYLGPGAVLNGRVVTSTGQGLAGICVLVGSPAAIQLGVAHQTVTDPSGYWSENGFNTSTQHIAYLPGCGSTGDWSGVLDAGKVHLVAPKTTTLPAFTMPPGGEISGVVTDSNGNPLSGVCVGTGPGLGGPYGVTGIDGSYVVHNVSPGATRVGFVPNCGAAPDRNLLVQYWPNQDNEASAQPVTVSAGQTTSGIDAALTAGGTISGNISGLDKYQLGNLSLMLLPDPGPVSYGHRQGSAASPSTAPSASSTAAGSTGTNSLVAPGVGVSTNLAADNGATIAASSGFEGFGIPTGAYLLMAFPFGGAELPVMFHGGPGLAGTSFVTALSVTAGTATAGANLVFPPSGSLRGSVKFPPHMKRDTVCLQITGGGTGTYLAVPVGPNGTFRVKGASAGSYAFMFAACNVHDNIAPVTISASVLPGATTVLKVKLGVGSIVSGTVMAGSSPVRDGCVSAFTLGGVGTSTVTDKQGRYRLIGLAPGHYQLTASPCGRSSLGEETYPSLVTLGRGQLIEGFDFGLMAGGGFSGTATRAGGAPAAGLCVLAQDPSSRSIDGVATTAADGSYRLAGLSTGLYLVSIEPGCGSDYLWTPEFLGGTLIPKEASYVSVTSGQQTGGVDMSVARDGSISGSVTDAGGAPLTGICVVAVPKPWTGLGPAFASTTDGAFTISGLASASYQIGFASGCGASGYATQWYDNSVTESGSRPVAVSPGADTPGVDATLAAG